MMMSVLLEQSGNSVRSTTVVLRNPFILPVKGLFIYFIGIIHKRLKKLYMNKYKDTITIVIV